jgi:carbamoyltransferase
MIVLGISPGHNSSIGIYKDGKILSLVSEERFSKIKNHLGFPHRALKYILNKHNISPKDIDLAVIVGGNSRSQIINLTSRGHIPETFSTNEFSLKNFLRKILPKFMIMSYSKLKWDFKEKLILEMYSKFLGIPGEKIIFIDGHLAHALSAAPNIKPGTLVMTLDGEHEKHCATVSIFDGNKVKFLSKTSLNHSLGLLYGIITEYLGMKVNEHEFKVMGLAPYAKGDRILKAKKVFDDLIWLKKDSLQFDSKIDMHDVRPYLDKKLRGYRFDYVAAAIQLKTEELIVEWVKRAIKKTGIHTLALSGGVFMNVKVNMLIGQLDEVKDLFIVPSAGDESCPIGCMFFGMKKLDKEAKIAPLTNLYFGPEYSNEEVLSIIQSSKLNKKYKIEIYKNMEEKIASLLSKGKIVARFKGRCEFGARSLGNRSILADASNREVVMEINEEIKNRDFWMPFAPSILYEEADKYIINPKKFFAPWMVFAFETKEKARKDLVAGLHPYDFTARPQMVTKEFSPDYYNLMKYFEKKTGRSGILNTSFNLHGEPMVCSIEDAMHTFEDSGLKYLAIENYLISKE